MDRSSSIRQDHAARARTAERRSWLSIDLRAHGPALEALAQSRRVRLSTLVRVALAEWLASRAAGGDGPSVDVSLDVTAFGLLDGDLARVTLRLPAASAARLAREARAAEMSRGLFVALLLEGASPMPVTADLKETRRALLSSTATLAALSSDLRAFERSLNNVRWVDVAACKEVIDPLPAALSRHLALASSALTALTPARRSRSRGSSSA